MVLHERGRVEKEVGSGVLCFDYGSIIASLSSSKTEEGKVEGASEFDAGTIEELAGGMVQAGYGSDMTGKVDHMQLWYGEKKGFTVREGEEDLYERKGAVSDVPQMMLTIPEAEETLQDIQYATALGAYHEVDMKTREKFSLWVMFNPALLGLFEASYKITGNVDYSKTV